MQRLKDFKDMLDFLDGTEEEYDEALLEQERIDENYAEMQRGK